MTVDEIPTVILAATQEEANDYAIRHAITFVLPMSPPEIEGLIAFDVIELEGFRSRSDCRDLLGTIERNKALSTPPAAPLRAGD